MPPIDQQEIGAAVDHLIANYPATATLDRYIVNGLLQVVAEWVNGGRFCESAEDAGSPAEPEPVFTGNADGVIEDESGFSSGAGFAPAPAEPTDPVLDDVGAVEHAVENTAAVEHEDAEASDQH